MASGAGLAAQRSTANSNLAPFAKCADGFHVERDEPTTKCYQTFDHDFDHSALSNVLSKYGDCYDTGLYDCKQFPICVPDGYTWSE